MINNIYSIEFDSKNYPLILPIVSRTRNCNSVKCINMVNDGDFNEISGFKISFKKMKVIWK